MCPVLYLMNDISNAMSSEISKGRSTIKLPVIIPVTVIEKWHQVNIFMLLV